MVAPRKTTVGTKVAPKARAVKTPEDVLDTLNGGVPDAPAVDDGDQEQTTETHDNSALTLEEVELATLRAQLAEANAKLSAQPDARPIPEAELTPEQRQIRELQDQLARTRGKDDSVEEHFDAPNTDSITIHFVAEGHTSNNRTFYTGQEVTFGPEAYADTLDRNGNSWLNMTEDEQYDRWGEVKFRKGPWPGLRHYKEPEAAQKSISTQAPAISI